MPQLKRSAGLVNKDQKNLKDEDIVQDFLSHPEKAHLFDQIISDYRPKLIRYVRSLGAEQNAAEDVVQNTFVKAYRNIRSFNPKKGKFSSWIYRIAHNTAMDQFKKDKKDLTVDDNDWWSQISAPENIQERLNFKLDFNTLAQNLSELDVKYRHPLTLYYLEGKSYKEIAAILRLPTPTVSTRIKRGRERLIKLTESKKTPLKEPVSRRSRLRSIPVPRVNIDITSVKYIIPGINKKPTPDKDKKSQNNETKPKQDS